MLDLEIHHREQVRVNVVVTSFFFPPLKNFIPVLSAFQSSQIVDLRVFASLIVVYVQRVSVITATLYT